MNVLDILALIVLALSVIAALIKGFFAELISLAAVIAGVILAILFYDVAAAPFEGLGLTSILSQLAGFLGIFLGTIVAGALVVKLFNRLLRALHLKMADRLLGAVFGLVRGGLINVVLFLALATFQVGGGLLATSRLAEFFLTSARLLVVLTPQDFKDRFETGYENVYRLWIEQTRQDHGRTAN